MSLSLFAPDGLRWPRWRATGSDQRLHRRHACCMPASIRYDGTHHDNDGLVLELSRAGLLFREGSQFVMDRAGTLAEIGAADMVLTGCIVRSDPRGHAVRFDELLDDGRVAALVDEFGLTAAP